MARLTPAQPRGLDPVRRLTYGAARWMYGSALEPSRAIAHHRPLLAGYGAFALSLAWFSHAVEDRVKRLATLRAAQLIGCEWCLDFGSRQARDAGLPEQDLRELTRWKESERFSDGMYCLRPDVPGPVLDVPA
jgi:AhpD family alkylhydroperoxidase